ncbi:MAG: hypothetical protein WC009_13025 [Methylotenera sp.]
MAHPYITVNGKTWVEILHHLQTALAAVSLQSGSSTDDTRAIVESYHKTIESKKDVLFELAAVGIVEYCNFYKVTPDKGVHDEFKGIYFTGIAVSKYLVQLGLVDINKLHLKAMLALLDFRLSSRGARRVELSDRVRSVINNNALDEHLGKYGWYLIYKCLFNAASHGIKQ